MKGVRIRLDAIIMKVICVANQKGGVAKTATTSALASILTQRGSRVLAIDMDPQGSLSKQAGAEPGGHEVYEVLKGNISALDAIRPLKQYHILPTSIVLAGLEAELMTDMGKYFKLRDAIEKAQLGKLYDYILIDTPPSLGVPTVNAIVAADGVLVPTDADCDSINGIIQLNTTIQNVKRYCNVNPKIMGIVFTKFDPRQNNSKDMMALAMRVADALNTQVFGTYIRAAVAVREAKSKAKDLVTSNPRSNVVLDYTSLAEEIFNKEV